jgi:hypothetical protein
MTDRLERSVKRSIFARAHSTAMPSFTSRLVIMVAPVLLLTQAVP